MPKRKKLRSWCDIRGKIHDREIANRHPDLVARIEALKAKGWRASNIMVGGLRLKKGCYKITGNAPDLVPFVLKAAEMEEASSDPRTTPPNL